MAKQQFVSIFFGCLLVSTTTFAAEQQRGSGFYGGVTYRTPGAQAQSLSIGIPANALSRFAPIAPVTSDDVSARSQVFGGYRWNNDLAVEAAVNTSDPYSLRPARAASWQGGVGVLPPTSLGLADVQARSLNVDLYTSWNFFRSFALYGRLGFAQNDLAHAQANAAAVTGEPRRLRDGVNYGVGVRYDLGSALGLRLEYNRFGRFAGELGSTPLESDQVTFGLQYRF